MGRGSSAAPGKTGAMCCQELRGELAIFQFLSDAEVAEIADLFEVREAARGEVLWREDDLCDYVGFVAEGRVEILKDTEFAGRPVVVGIYSRGAVVGELCFLDHGRRAVSAKALDDVVLAVLPLQRMQQLFDDRPVLGVKLLKGFLLACATRLRGAFERLAQVF